MSSLAPSTEARQVARAAAQWLALLESGGANAGDHARLQHWRDSDTRHEHAWQKAQQLRERFAGLPPALALASLDRPALDRRQLLKRTLAVAAVVPSAWLVARQMPWDSWTADVRTATGERRSIALLDGASLQLNTATAVDLDLAARSIRLLEGEVALSVPGPQTNTVLTSAGQVRVGQGDICVRQLAHGCEVAVVRGSAQLMPLHGASMLLQAGEQVRLLPQGVGPLSAFDGLQLGWRDGVLTAMDQPLGDFLEELNRYRPGVLRWSPPVAALRVTGIFRLDDTDRILRLLSASLPIEVQSRTRYWVTVQMRKPMS
ncbi:FecR domain-containing protein [Pseudomonas sp. MWU16-30317]|uniref:FecR domain-containing protein n=1 Tax=Pseudomonas sp. MWU16-30317 TaxID=2878095 RepID=UPI001CFB9562